MIRRHLQLLAAICLASLPTLALAAPVTSDTDKKTESPAEKTRKALEKTMDIDIPEQALQSAVAKLREDTKLNFVLDSTTLINFVGIDPNSVMVKVQQKNAKLKTSVRMMLSQYHLSYAI